MKLPLLLLLASLSAAMALETPGRKRQSSWPSVNSPPVEVSQDPRPFVNDPAGGGMGVQGHEEDLREHATLTIVFPSAVVAADKIDAEGVESPVEIWPALDAEFFWRTQSQGELTIKGPVIPGQTYRFRLRADARNLAGEPLPAGEWGFEASAPSFRVVEGGYGEREDLSSRPQVPLSFNYPVRLIDAARGVWFQDRVTRERFPAEILLDDSEGQMDSNAPVVDVKEEVSDVTDFRVRPVSPLPPWRRIDLVVEGVRDAYASRTSAYPRVFPVGFTSPLAVEYVAARHRPLEKPVIEVKFSERLADEPLPGDALRITPDVRNLRLRREGEFIHADGEFDPQARYVVRISPAIRGESGYTLPKSEKWGATFRGQESAILLPSPQIRERSAMGLRVAFYQVNTSELEWKLATVPLDKLREVRSHERDFEKVRRDDEGNPVWTAGGTIDRPVSEPLATALGLGVVATGAVPASEPGKDMLREVAWLAPQDQPIEGPMLFEVTGKDAHGRAIGNRALIYFGESIVTRKVGRHQTTIRVAGMKDGLPRAGVRVAALDEDLVEIAAQPTGPDGLAVFENLTVAATKYYRAGDTLQPVELSAAFDSGSPTARGPPPLRSFIFSDRPLYRPGQTVQFKGLVRNAEGEALKVPAKAAVKWTIERAYRGEALAQGEAIVDAEGGWNAIWQPPPAGSPIGEFFVKATIAGQPAADPARFRIEEFRNPAFSVVCEEVAPAKAAESAITVNSQYFHGSPNSAARVEWTATWLTELSDGDEMTRTDRFSERAKEPVEFVEASGTAILDVNGRVTLRCASPFKDPGNRPSASVVWKVDVTGPDGQTLVGGVTQQVAMEPVLLGVRAEDRQDSLKVSWDAKEKFGKAPQSVSLQLFRVQTKTVKERLAPEVYRYRNFSKFDVLVRRNEESTGSFEFRPPGPGRYVAVISPPRAGPGFPVSEEIYFTGPGEADLAVQSDNQARVLAVGREDRPWLVGETATLKVLAPTAGIAWVSVETDGILETFTTPIDAAGSVQVPIKAAYEPNVFVSVYVIRPGGAGQLPGEMFGFAALRVEAPNRVLDVKVRVQRPEYEPREKVSGEVTVTAGGKRVTGADLAIYAVDDSILELGGWRLPDLLGEFFPARAYGIVTFSALDAYLEKFAPERLTMKGYVVGDAGVETFANVTFTRKEFKPLILWQPSVKTNADGVAAFQCEAPDDLTRFRVIAVGQTTANQFGAGSSVFAVSRKLQIEPALPRFLRAGDEIELRAIVRQKASDSEKLTVRCRASGNLELVETAQQEVNAAKDAPVVVRFKARARNAGSGVVRFEAASAGAQPLSDSVEITVPVAEPVILRKESVAGPVKAPVLDFSKENIPAAWKDGSGVFTASVSSTPWLSKLMGLPFLLEYPHGCFEQKASRLLACTHLAGLLEFLPDAGARKANYEAVIYDTLREFEASLLRDGRLPYWPKGTEPNDFVTIEAAWCVAAAEEAGIAVPERLASELPTALDSIAGNQTGASPTLRAFALFAALQLKNESTEPWVAAASELYLERDKLTDEGRALLAITMQTLKDDPVKARQLVAEFPKEFQAVAFNPYTFASATRTEALCLWARLLVDPQANSQAVRDRLAQIMEQAPNLSTQENLWLLVAFRALTKSAPPARLAGLSPAPDAVSGNGSAVSWSGRLDALAGLAIRGAKPGGSFVVRSEYRSHETETASERAGMRVDRIVKNLTDSSRNGSAATPFKLGDQLLISYRFGAEKPQNFVALEDLLPAGIEVVNPNLAMFREHYAAPSEPGVDVAPLSHSEIRDQQTNLYFDAVPSGAWSYSVLARVTAAGTFIWPATQISPMYDSRVYGRTASSSCFVTSKK